MGMSDHLLTYCTRKVTRAYVNKHKTIRIRSSKKYSQEQFIHNLMKQTGLMFLIQSMLTWHGLGLNQFLYPSLIR